MDTPVPPVVGASGLTKAQTRTTLAVLNVSILIRAVCDCICGGTTFLFVAFALALGINPAHMGYLAAALGYACVLQLVGLLLSGRTGDKKRYVLTLSYLEPCLVIAAVLTVPFLPQGMRIYVLGLAMFAAAGLLHLTRPFTEEWSASTVPAGLRGRYLGRRMQALTVVGMFSTLAAAFLADRLPKDQPLGYAVLMAVGGLFGLLAVLPLRHVSLPTVSAEARVDWRDLIGVGHHRPFRLIVAGTLLYCVSFMLAIPYYQVMNLEVLGMSKLAVAGMQIGYLVLKFAVTPLMGRAVDRWGARVVMVAVGPIYTVFFFMYVLATPEHRWPVFLGWALAGIADCAYGLAYFSALYGALPQDRTRSGYLAVMNLLTLGAYATGAALAGLLIQPLANVHVELPGFTLGPVAGWSWSYPGTTIGQFQALYVVATLLMLVGTFAAILYPRRDTRRQPRPEADEVLLGH